MEWSREYLERHNIHRVMEDCVEDLVVDQPPTKAAIVKSIIQRLETIRRRYDNPQQKVVLVLADPHSGDFRKCVDAAASACGASVIDCLSSTSEEVRDLLSTSFDKAFVLNFPATVGDAIAFEGCFGKPHKTVLFQSSSFAALPRSDPAFLPYAKGINAVAELYRAKKQLVTIRADDDATASLIAAFS